MALDDESDDEEVFGDFEDLETGEKHEAKDKNDSEGKTQTNLGVKVLVYSGDLGRDSPSSTITVFSTSKVFDWKSASQRLR